MYLKTLSTLRQYKVWRESDTDVPQPNPKDIDEALSQSISFGLESYDCFLLNLRAYREKLECLDDPIPARTLDGVFKIHAACQNKHK